MTRLKYFIFTTGFGLLALSASGEDLLLRLQPDAATPVVQRIVATEKVLLDAGPVPDAPEWQQLNLVLPLEGYVPTAALSKNFEIHKQTPVRFLPSAKAFQLTTIEPGDRHEIRKAEAAWTRLTLEKTLTVYFAADRSPAEIDPDEASKITVPEPPALELPVNPGAAGADRRTEIRFDPAAGLGTRSPDELLPENVAWKAGPRSPAPTRQPQTKSIEPIPRERDRPTSIMVGPAETQAREERSTTEAPAPNQPSRQLSGILAREIREDGPAYPIRLNAPEGRLIAYVDLSEMFINDLSPFIGQRVELRGPIQPLRPGDRRLVLFARDIQLAE